HSNSDIENCKRHYCEHVVRGWACKDDCCPLPHRFVVERDGALRGGHLPLAAICLEHAFRLAEHLHITAERERAELPARTEAISDAEQLGTKCDREDLDAYAAPSSDPEMAELMNKHDDGQQHEQADDIVRGADKQIQHAKLIILRGASLRWRG